MRRVHWLIWSLCAALLCGCATARTLTGYRPGDPVFLSGTRLGVAASANVSRNTCGVDIRTSRNSRGAGFVSPIK